MDTAASLMDQIIQIGMFVLALVVVWVVMKFVMKIAMRVFAFGCGAIVVLGLLLGLMRWVGS